LKNASLVQESLQHLLLATEDVVGPDDGEILGAIVNWEATVQPRNPLSVHSSIVLFPDTISPTENAPKPGPLVG